jgi:uroporphyrinogen-III synthase
MRTVRMLTQTHTTSKPRILVTREDPRPVIEAVTLADGEPIELPLLVTRWLEFELPGDRTLDDYDIVAFTSARAVEALARAAERRRWSWPPSSEAAAVGDRTANELCAHAWMPECVSSESTARSLVTCLLARGVKGRRVLFPASALADTTLPEGLHAAGAIVDVVPVYTTETPWTHDPQRKQALAPRLAAALRGGGRARAGGACHGQRRHGSSACDADRRARADDCRRRP